MPRFAPHLEAHRPIKVRAEEEAKRVYAPTWEMMDAAIAEQNVEWRRRAMTIMRYTGLRPGTVMHIDWSHVGLETGHLSIAHDKSVQAQGRVVPISSILVEEMAGWGRREGYVLQAPGRECRERKVQASYFVPAWKRSGVPREYWHGQPCKAFRKGFKTQLYAAGCPRKEVSYLIGHTSELGIDLRYVGAEAYKLREVVEQIPGPKKSQTVYLTCAQR